MLTKLYTLVWDLSESENDVHSIVFLHTCNTFGLISISLLRLLLLLLLLLMI